MIVIECLKGIVKNKKYFSMIKSINVFGKKLSSCCKNPMTGFFRNGCCDTSMEDQGVHTVCILATEEFLAFSQSVGNDLSTPLPRFGFFGIKPGDKWCLCALRWLEAYKANMAPPVILESTHYKTLEYVSIEQLQQHAIQLDQKKD